MSRTPATVLPSNEELACRAQRGCRASFEELMRRFQTPVLHFLQQRGARQDAEDVLQETFCRAYTQLHRFRAQWRFSTWLFTIARRASINYHRRTQPAADDAAVRMQVSTAPGPLDLLIEKDRGDYLWSAAARVLSEEERTAMWLHYVEGMPAREIGAILGRSWVSVKTMMFRARKRLLPFISELEPEGLRRRVRVD